ncbi:MAG: hypothetical protein ACPLKQ_02750 [Candidatus Bathyarchaeales archaeon]
MSEENVEVSETPTVIDVTVAEERISEGGNALEQLKVLQENLGQMLELSKEESDLIKEFFNLLTVVLKPFCESLEISISSLPIRYQTMASRSFLDRNGRLIIVDKNGGVETLNLLEHKNHSLVIDIMGEIIEKLGAMVNSQRSKIEKRVKILMPITKELQKVAKVFEEL